MNECSFLLIAIFTTTEFFMEIFMKIFNKFKTLFVVFLFLSLFFTKSNSQQITYFSEGFEGDTTGKFKSVLLSASTDRRWSKITSHYQSGNAAVRFDTANIGDLQDAGLEMINSVNITNSTFPILTFYQMCMIESPTQKWDLAFVEVSTDNGVTWSVIPTSEYISSGTYFPQETPTSRSNYTPPGPFFHIQSYNDWRTALGGEQSVPESPGGTLWKKEQFILANYKVANLKLRFHLNTDDAVLWWGWAVDNISIAEPEFANDIKPNQVDKPVLNEVILQGTSFTPQATIRNVGNTSQTDIPVTYKIYNSYFDIQDSIYVPNEVIYTSSGTISSLTPAQMGQLSFTETAIDTPGRYFAVTISGLSGDQNIENDSIASMFIIGSTMQGEFIVGGTGANFNTLKEAIEFLNTSIVVGNATFLLNKAIFSEGFGARLQASFLYPDSNHTVTIKPAPGISPRIVFNGTTENPYGLSIQNSRNLIIDGSNDGTNSRNMSIELLQLGGVMATTLQMVNCKNIEIKNIKLTGFRNNAVGASSVVTLIPSGTNINKNVTFDNLEITKGNYGIFLSGQSSSKRDTNITVRNCYIGQVGSNMLLTGGIYANNIDSLHIYNNEIAGVARDFGFGAADVYGIHLNVRFSDIYNNRVHNIRFDRNEVSDTAMYVVHGIRVNGNVASLQSRNKIYNNEVFGLYSAARNFYTQRIFGIRVSRGKYDTVAHNTVYLSGRQNANDTTAAFVLDSTSAYVVNNIFYNGRQDSTGGLSLAFWKRVTTHTSSKIDYSDNNVFYSPSPTGHVGAKGIIGLTKYKTLTDWRSIQTATDTNSVYGNPVFVKLDSLENLHIPDDTLSWAESRGTPTVVPFDKDGNMRDVISPDAGAYEFSGIRYPNYDMTTASMESPRPYGTKLQGVPFKPIVVFYNAGAKTMVNSPMNFKYRLPGEPDFINQFQGDTIISIIGPNEYKIVEFRPITLDVSGEFQARAEAGAPIDENPENNSLNFIFYVTNEGGLSGVKTVGEFPARYLSITEAIYDLRSAGMVGSVELQLVDAQYNESPILIDTTVIGLSATKTLTIKPAPNVSSVVNITPTNEKPYGIRIDKVSGVTIDGSNLNDETRNIQLNVLGQYGRYGVWISGGGYGSGVNSVTKPAKYNTVKSVKIVNGGISATGGDITGYYGVYLVGRIASNVPRDSFNSVINCDISEFGQAGILVRNNDSPTFEKNDIHGFSRNLSGIEVRGIWDSLNVSNATIGNNKVYDIFHTGSGGTVYGIDNSGGTNSNAIVYNNMVYNILASGTSVTGNKTYGIYGGRSENTNDKYYYNSVYLAGHDSANSVLANNRASAIEVSGSNIEVKNNIFANIVTHNGPSNAGKSFAIYLGIATNFTSDYNVFYAPGEKGFTGYYNQSSKKTLVDWQSAFVMPTDTNSVLAYPQFFGTGNLHIDGAVRSVVESWGSVIAGFDKDIDGETRNSSTPDVGADEYNGIPAIQTEFGAVSVDDPVLGKLKRGSTPFAPKATISNNGSKKQNGVHIEMSFIDANNQVAVISDSFYNIPSYTTMQIPFPTTQISSSGWYTAKVKTYLSNDADPSNDESSIPFEVLMGLNGTKNVPGDYTSIAGILDTLSQVGVDQPLVVNLVNQTYNLDPIVIESIQGVSATNTVTFKGTNVNGTIINGLGTPELPTAIHIKNGTEYVVFDKLKINAVGVDGKYGMLINGSNNTVQNCEVSNVANADNSNNGLFAIYLKGNSSSQKGLNNVISNNIFSKFGQSAVRLENQDGAIVEKNQIGNWTQTSNSTDFKTIWNYLNSTNTTVRGNIISNIISQVNGTRITAIEDSAGSGNANFLCYNNIIFGLSSNASGTSGNTLRGIALTSANEIGAGVYHNSIYFNGHSSSSAQASYVTGFEASTNNTSSFALKNNIFYVNYTHSHSSARSYGVRIASSQVPASAIYSNNNLFYIIRNDENPQGFIGKFGTAANSDKLNLNNWQSTGLDAQSKTGDPRFVSGTDLHIQTVLPRSNAAGFGTTIASVTKDIDGNDRNTNAPDIGADEFTVISKVSGKVVEDADGLMSTTNDRTILTNWKVSLLQNGSEVASVYTDASGKYSFDNLQSGTYLLFDSLKSTYAALGEVVGTGADTAIVNRYRLEVMLSDGDDAINYDIVDYRPSTISLRIFEDGDGSIFTENDFLSKNWRVNIYRVSQTPVTLVASLDTTDYIDATLGAGKYAIVIADSTSPQWSHIGKKVNGVTFAGNYSSDTINLAAASSHSVDFVNYLSHTIAVRIVEDGDGSFSFTQSDTVAKEWGIRIQSLDGSQIDVSVASNANLVHTYLHEGTYLVTITDSLEEDRLWQHLGIIRDEVRERKIGINSDTVVLTRGGFRQLVFVNSRIYPDTTMYRTFLPTPLSFGTSKAIKLKPKKGVYPTPNIANVLQSAYSLSYPKGTAMLVGKQVIGSEKTKLWATYTKAASFVKLFSTEHTGNAGPFVIPTNGKKAPLKDPKYDAVKLNNKLFSHLVALKLNIASSDNNIVVDTRDEIGYKLGDLLYRGTDTTFYNMSLRQIYDLADSMLTYDSVFQSNMYTRIYDIISGANNAFYDSRPLTVGDTAIGIGPAYGYSDGKWGTTFIKIKGTITVDESNSPFVRDVSPPDKMFVRTDIYQLPTEYALEQNYPNPFNPTTTIEFYLPEDANITLKVYNVIGQEVATILDNQFYEAGNDFVDINASNLASGVYFYRLSVNTVEGNGKYTFMKKMVLTK